MAQQNKITAFKQFTKVISTSLSGRDKFNKAIQYSSKTLWFSLNEPQIVDKLKKLDSGISTARKVDRMFWSLVDIQKVFELLNDSKLDHFIKILAIFGALCSAYHWYTDNMIFLSKIKVFDNIDLNAIAVRGSKADLIAISIGLYLLYLKCIDEQNDKKLHIKKVKFFGMCCDLIHALDDSGMMQKLTGKSLNAGQYGIVGLLSALSTLYRCWNA